MFRMAGSFLYRGTNFSLSHPGVKNKGWGVIYNRYWHNPDGIRGYFKSDLPTFGIAWGYFTFLVSCGAKKGVAWFKRAVMSFLE